jgi:polyisoprenyl-teichoic acid--peptidoglycan teichoic acid transferase
MNQTYVKRRRRTLQFTPLMWALLVVFMIAACITAYLTFAAVREVVSAQFKPREVPEVSLSGGTPEAAVPISLLSINTPLQPATGPTPQAWDGANRVTVLLMGLDFRDWEGEGPSRTDTMMLFTLDPVSRTAGMLSIPRDLWVFIPEFGYGKINTAHYLGDMYDIPGGGPGLAMQTVEQFLGVPINYYVRLDFSAFERFIDQIGGVEINVPEEITVDPLGPGNTVTLEPGLQVLDGPTALAYARNRDTAGGDFDRAQRQQQVILAIRSRILNLEMLPTLIEDAPEMYQELASGIMTNLTIQEIIQLAWLAQQIPEDNIRSGAIGPNEVTFSVSPDGLDILQPDPDAIRKVRDQVFAINSAIGPTAAAGGNPQELALAENPRISVLNATNQPGLAAETSDFLKSKELNITLTGNATEISPGTVIIDYTGKPYTVQYLVDLMGIQSDNIYSRYDPNSEIDVAILLGEDWAANNPMP